MGSIDAPKLKSDPIKPDSDFSFKDYMNTVTKDRVAPTTDIFKDKTNPTGLATGKGRADTAIMPERYAKTFAHAGLGAFDSPSDMERQAYLSQSGSQIFSNALSGFVNQASAGFLKAIASWDVEGITNMAMGNTEKQYGNWLDHIADDIMKKSQTEDVIFQKGDNSMMNPAYWANQFQSMGLTGGIILEAMAEQGIAALVTGGSTNALALGNKARLLRSLGKQFTHGSIKGIQEAYTNALDTQAQVYQKYLDLGYDDEVAKKKSAEAASIGFRAESIPLMVLNGLQFAGTFGTGTKLATSFKAGERVGLNSGFSGAAEGVLDYLLPNVKSKAVKGAIGFGANAASEAIEEGIQTGVSKYAEYKTLKSTGDVKGDLDLFKDTEMRDSMIGGALGGALFSAIGKVFAPLIKGTNARRIDHVYNNFLNQAPARSAEAFKIKAEAETNFAQAITEYNKDKSNDNLIKVTKAEKAYKDSQANSQLTSSLNALHLDYITGKTTAFESHIEQMQGILDAIKSNDTEKLKAYNLANEDGTEKFAGSFNYVNKNFAKNIADSHSIKSMLDNNLTHLTSDFESAWGATHKEYLNKEHLEDIADIQGILDGSYANDNQFKQLSPQGQQRFKLDKEITALVDMDNFKPLSEANKSRLAKLQQQFVESPQYDDTDIPILKTIDARYQQGELAKVATREEIARNNKELVNLKDATKIRSTIEARIKKQASKAETKEELTQIAKEAQEAGMTASIQQTLAEAQKNIVAQQEAEELARQQQENSIVEDKGSPADQKAKSVIVGNGSLFGEGMSDITVFEPVDEIKTDKAARAADMLAAPAGIDQNKFTDEERDKLKNAVGKMIQGINPSATFEDLVRNFIQGSSKEMGDKHFSKLVEGWKLNGKQDENYETIYNNIFSNPISDIIGQDILINEAEELKAKDQQQTTAQTNITEVETKVLEHNIGEPIITGQGTVEYVLGDTPYITGKPILSTFFSLTNKTVNEDGTEAQSPNEEWVDSTPLLHPDLFREGTELTVEIPPNFMGITINVYNADGSKTASMSFGDYVRLNKLTPEMQEYKDKVPMVAYRKGRPSQEKGLAFIHDVTFYGAADEATATHTRRIRETVHTGKSISITITRKKTTNFDAFRTPIIGTLPDDRPEYQFIPFSEGNPEVWFAIGDKGGVIREQDKLFGEDSENTMQRQEGSKIEQGKIYELRRAGWKDGKKTWNLIEVTPQPISEEVKTTVWAAIDIYLNRYNPNQATRKLHDEIKSQVLAITGLDLTNTENFRDYLKMFINVRGSNDDFEDADNFTKVTGRANATINPKDGSNVGYIHVQQGGAVYVGATRTNHTKPSSVTDGQTIYANANEKGFYPDLISKVLKLLTKKYIGSGVNAKSILDSFSHNYSPIEAKRNRAVAFISADNKVTQKAASYQEYMAATYTTNVKAINIAEEGKPPVYASSSVAIEYGLTSEITKKDVPFTTEQVVEQASVSVVEQEIIKNDIVKEDFAKAEAEILARAQKELGIDFNNYTNFDDLGAVAGRTPQQRIAYNNLGTRIAGLEPQEDHQLNNFIYHQIGPILDEKGTISNEEIRDIIAGTMDNIINKVKAERLATIKVMENFMAKVPDAPSRQMATALAAYKAEVAKMNILQTPQNMKLLFDNAREAIEGTQGVKDAKIVLEERENEDDRESWQKDALSIDPNAKTSARLKRFYGSIPILDKDGNPKKGLFGLTTYYSIEDVATLTKALLADTPADFKTMLDKLKITKDKYPWLVQQPSKETREANPGIAFNLIDKLEKTDHQTGNQFVSDNAMSSLRLKFIMVLFDRKTSSYKTKVWDANEGGVIDQILSNWKNKFAVSNLIQRDTDDEGALVLNDIFAKSLIRRFNRFKGIGVPELESVVSPQGRTIIGSIRGKNKTTINPTKGTPLYEELHTKLVDEEAIVRYRYSTARSYQITNKGNNNFEISVYEEIGVTKEEINNYLKEFGIELHPKALDDLMTNGLPHNYQKGAVTSFKAQFDEGGLFGILNKSLLKAVSVPGEFSYSDSGSSPLKETIIKSLAALEYKYNSTIVPVGGFANGKNFYAITQNKFATERALALTARDSKVKKELESLSFSKHSLWLELLGEDKFRENFAISHVAFNAMQILGKQLRDDAGLNKLSSLDYEVASLGGFWHSEQGEVGEGSVKRTYRGTDIVMRMATMLMPTMSDKETGLWVKTAVLSLQNKDLNSGRGISDDVKKVLFEQTVLPEMERMLKFYQKGGKTNIKSYDKGAGMFMFMPKLNTVPYNKDGLNLRDAIATLAQKGLTIESMIADTDLRDRIYDAINTTVVALQTEQIEEWTKMGIIETKEGKATKVNFIDSKYFNKFTGSIQDKVNMAALDSVVNQMVHLSNSYMVFGGDPALYYKSGAKRENFKNDQAYYTQVAIDSFINAGKRLANQIAPGVKLAESEDEKYLQLFIEDRKTIGDRDFIQYVTKILDGTAMSDEEHKFMETYLGEDDAAKKAKTPEKTAADIKRHKDIGNAYPKSAGFFEIEGSDAQEYTTWQEHLNILEKMGRHPDILSSVTEQDIADARKLFGSDKKNKDLTEKDKALIGLILQPLKPVVTGQQYDKAQDVMRTVYIKTSSFPLIPQLTVGFEIDKLRDSMEKLYKSEGIHVRAAYTSGVKVGATNNTQVIWDAEGKAIAENISPEALLKSSLRLDRKNFRIQQDIPFKSGKNDEDKVSMGTQLMKLLFGNNIMSFSNFTYQGRSDWTGVDLQREFSDLHTKLVELKKTQLHEELGLNSDGRPIDYAKSMAKIQKLLRDEGQERGFPRQVLDGLILQGEGDNTQFTLPLWSSINSNKFENLLNAIVTNRVAKIKFPGNAYVAGSPEGFKIRTLETSGIDKSQIVFTDSWDNDSLKASYHRDDRIKKVQIMVASKFRALDGTMINMLSDEWSEVGKDGVRRVKKDKFDAALFNLTTFRTPTTGISSATQVEIVGFLPHTNGDLMILPTNITKQKGLDFDVDKETGYQYHHILHNGKFERLGEDNKQTYYGYKFGIAMEAGKADAAVPDDFNEQDFQDKEGKKVNNELQAKLLQNKIIEIYESVLSNPNEQLQAKINSVLSTDYTESEAARIENMTPVDRDNWTPLSQQYQKMKLNAASSGVIGKGAYSMDVVFHSLAEQASVIGKPMELHQTVLDENGKSALKPIDWRFGKLTAEDGGIQSDGILGRTETLDGDRTIADVLNEVAQIAVDNEKLQIMGKTNLNSLTLDVHKVFNLLGFDKFKTKGKHSVAFLFMSQPIIREYVEKVGNANAMLNTDFDPDRNNNIVIELMEKYHPDIMTAEMGDALKEEMADLMSEKNMSEAIMSTSPETTHGKLQAGILMRFREMEAYGLAIRSIQTTLNVDSKGLGKSFFDVVQKKEKIDGIGNGTQVKDGPLKLGEITNVMDLVGDYKPKKPQDPRMPAMSNEDIRILVSQGYYDMGTYLVKPSTYVGAFNVVTVHTAYNAWKDFMPFDSPFLKDIFNELLPIVQSDPNSNSSRTVELKQDILSELKKYLATLPQSGFIDIDDDINKERERLYIDSETNTSLATYIQRLMETTDNPIVDAFIKSNKLFNSLRIEPSKVGLPSLIRFNNTKGEAFDEAQLYEALSGLMEVRGKAGVLTLPTIGNKSYTLDTLAQDMINYAMLGNAKQEAIQFTKYVPVQYLNDIGYSFMMRNFHEKLTGKASEDSVEKTKAAMGLIKKPEDEFDEDGKRKPSKTRHIVSEFTNQYIQHNPELVRANVNSKEAKNKLKKVPGTKNEFTFDEDFKPTFIKVYDPFTPSKKKFRLYKYNGTTYNQIPILGVFGMDEYQFGNPVGKSIVNEMYQKSKKGMEPSINQKSTGQINNAEEIKSEDSLKSVVDMLSRTDGPYKRLAELLLPYIGANKVVLSDYMMRGGKQYFDYHGAYNPATTNIGINPKILSNPELLAEIVLHEAVHSLTHDKVKEWVTTGADGFAKVKDGAPKYARDLTFLFNTVRATVSTKELEDLQAKISSGTATEAEISDLYGLTSVDDFMAQGLTDRDFQKKLNTIKYGNGTTALDKFKAFVESILNSLGIAFKADYSAAHAISTIFEIIGVEEKTEANPYEDYYAEASEQYKMDLDIDPWQGDAGEQGGEMDSDPEGDKLNLFAVAAMSYPDTKYVIGNTECK